jgi:hypothetical protein
MRPDEYAFRRPYHSQIACPDQAFRGDGLVDDPDRVGIASVWGGIALGDLQPVLEQV